MFNFTKHFPYSNKRILFLLSCTLVVDFYFWIQSRYAAFDKKVQMGASTSASGIVFDIAFPWRWYGKFADLNNDGWIDQKKIRIEEVYASYSNVAVALQGDGNSSIIATAVKLVKIIWSDGIFQILDHIFKANNPYKIER